MADLMGSVKFTETLYREYSATSKADSLGSHVCEMSLYKLDTPGCYFIEWDLGPTLDESYEIGIWCERNENGKYVIYDYDGVMSLPKEAVQLLKDHGIEVPEDF